MGKFNLWDWIGNTTQKAGDWIENAAQNVGDWMKDTFEIKTDSEKAAEAREAWEKEQALMKEKTQQSIAANAQKNVQDDKTEQPDEPTYSQAYQDYQKYMDAYNKGMDDYLSGEKFSDAETERDKYYKLAQDYMDKYINRDSFSYDVNTDKMYAMYRDQYLNQAQQAQKDAMAQAAALTGGYGSTYASAMGQRAYSAEMDKLDAKASELYDNAYARYVQEGQNMLDDASLYGSQAETLENRIASDKANMLSNAQLQYTLGQQKYQESDEYKNTVAEEEKESTLESLKNALANDAEITPSPGYKMQKGEKTGFHGIANAIDLERDLNKHSQNYTKDDYVDEIYKRLSGVTIGGTPMTEDQMVAYVDWVVETYPDLVFKKDTN